MKKYRNIIVLSVLLFPSCQVRFASVSFRNKTKEDIYLVIENDFYGSKYTNLDSIPAGGKRGYSVANQPKLGVKKSMTVMFDQILITTKQQDTLLYLANKSEIDDYLKDKRVVDRSEIIVNITKPKERK